MANTYQARLDSDDPDQNGRLVDVSSESATVGTHLALTKDLSTHPNTEDGAIVEQAGLEIAGPAWVRGDMVVSDFTMPGPASNVSLSIWLLDADWASGETDALQIVSAGVSSSSDTTGGVDSATVGSNRLFVRDGVTATVGLRCQPQDGSANPVAGLAGGTLRAIIFIERTA